MVNKKRKRADLNDKIVSAAVLSGGVTEIQVLAAISNHWDSKATQYLSVFAERIFNKQTEIMAGVAHLQSTEMWYW